MTKKFLAGRVALVTGGASGMGRAMALAFAEAGCDIAIGSLLAGAQQKEKELSYLPGQKDLDESHAQIEALGVRCFASDLDITSDESVDTFVSEANQIFGQVNSIS